jgi:hypothetical protein
MSSSETGPAVMPSGGLLVRARYSCSRRRCAVDDAISSSKVYSFERKGFGVGLGFVLEFVVG